MKFTEQCNTAIKNANSTLGLIRRTIKCKSKNIITKGHALKIIKNRSRVNVRKNFFSQRVVNDWNALPVWVVDSESVNSFKNNYDKYVGNKRKRLGLSRGSSLDEHGS